MNENRTKCENLYGETYFIDLSMAFLRIFIGASILVHGLYKATDLFFYSNLLAFYHVPMSQIMAPVLAYGQVIIGLMLVLGLFTRVASIFMVVASAITMLLVYKIEPLYVRELAMSYFFISLVFFFRGGARYSVDNILYQSCKSGLKKREGIRV